MTQEDSQLLESNIRFSIGFLSTPTDLPEEFYQSLLALDKQNMRKISLVYYIPGTILVSSSLSIFASAPLVASPLFIIGACFLIAGRSKTAQIFLRSKLSDSTYPFRAAFNNLLEEIHEIKLKILRGREPEEKAYTCGATVGVLQKILPTAPAWHVGLFLSRRDGGNLAQVSFFTRTTADAAKRGLDLDKIQEVKHMPRETTSQQPTVIDHARHLRF